MLTLAAVAVLAASSAAQGGDDFWGFLKPGTILRHCPDGSKEQAEAEAAYRALDPEIQALADDADAMRSAGALRSLLRTPCFQMAVENGPLALPSHPTALRHWWTDGGKYWLWSYIHPGRTGRTDDLRSTTTVPPGPRKVLSRETTDDPALQALLCGASDAACGAETSGWTQRAEGALAAARPRRRTWHDKDPTPAPWLRCEATAAPPRAYETWRACVGSIDERVKTLPLGRTRSPRDGWLVVTGRRGHYEFCDAVSVFDAATGAAYRAESCSGLRLGPDGSVDVEATEDRRPAVRTGRVPLDNIREALWMIVLTPRTELVHARARSYPLPRGVEALYAFEAVPAPPEYGFLFGGHSGQTRLEWTWFAPDGAVRAQGSLLWWSDDLAEAHAGELLRVAEGGFVEGCPPATPPALSSTSASVNQRDAAPAGVKITFERLWTALRAHRSPACARH